MNEKDQTTEYTTPASEQSFYQTGSTRPPKNRGGLVAVLLAAVIILGGIVSVLSLLNIRLFRQVRNNPEENDPYVQFTQGETTVEETQSSLDIPTPNNGGGLQLELNNTPQAIPNIPQEGGLSLQEIYTKAIGAVVSISCASPEGDSTGTGVILSSDGYIITNCHVVQDAQNISVLLADETSLPATLVGTDSLSDLAVLHVQATDLTPAEFGDSGSLQVGDSVVAIGDPLGIELRGTMTNGIVSAINRNVSSGGRTMTLIQTNAALNSGNSGGPLLNCYGQVIGINTMKIGDHMSSAGVEGLGFAIPSTTVKEIVDQLLTQGYVSGRPDIGFTGESITSFDRLYYRFPQGVYITQVAADSDAAQKGIASGDILLQLEGTRITDTDTLEQLLYSHKAGDPVEVIIYRGGRQFPLEIILGEAT